MKLFGNCSLSLMIRTVRGITFGISLSWAWSFAQTIENQGRTFFVDSRAGVPVYLDTTISVADRNWHANNIEAALLELFAAAPQFAPILRTFPTWVRNHTYPNMKVGGLSAAIFDSDPESFGVSIFHPSFNSVTTQSYRALIAHEYGHGFEGRCLRTLQRNLMDASYQAAVSEGLYLNVQDQFAENVPAAYALTDAEEYFAELFAAFFVTNDTFPFDRSDLLAYDPGGHALVSSLLQLDIAGQYQPDMLFWNGKRHKGDNRYESSPRKQKERSSKSCSKKKACLRVENDGAHSFVHLSTSKASSKLLRSLVFKLITVEETNNISAGIRAGRAVSDIGDGYSRNLNVLRKRSRKTDHKKISVRIKAASEFFSYKSDSYEVTFDPR